MKKTKLGISIGLLAAVMYFMGLFGGYLITLLLAGYVLWFEEDEWLKKTAVKVVLLMLIFSGVPAVINLIPNLISVLNSLVAMFGGSIYGTIVISFINNGISAITSIIDIIEKIVFIGLGLMSLNQKEIAIPGLDKMVDKYMS